MKKLLASLLILFLLLAFGELCLESRYFQELSRKWIVKNLEKTGISVTIGQIEGKIPYHAEFKNVTWTSSEALVSIESLECNFSLLGLLNREITCNELQAKGVVVETKIGEKQGEIELGQNKKLPFAIRIKHFKIADLTMASFSKVRLEGDLSLTREYELSLKTGIDSADTLANLDLQMKRSVQGGLKGRLKGTFHAPTLFQPLNLETWTFFSRFQTGKEGSAQISDLKLFSSLGTLRAKEITYAEGEIQGATLRIHTNLPNIDGTIVVSRKEGILHGEASLRSPSLVIYNTKIKSIGTNTQFSWDGTQLKGDGVVSGEMFSKIWTGKTDFSWKKNASLFLPAWDLRSASIDLKGATEIKADKTLFGHAEMDVGNLQDISSDLYGSASLKSKWNGDMDAQIDGKLSNFYWKDLFAQSISFYSDIKNPFEIPQGNIYLDMAHLKWGSFALETTNIEIASDENGSYPFKLFTEGEWKHPLELHLDGTLSHTTPRWTCNLKNGTGSFFNHPIALSHPVNLEIAPDLFILPSLELTLDGGNLKANMTQEKENMSGGLVLENFPLDVFSLNPLELGIQGNTNVKVDFEKIDQHMTADLNASIDRLKIASLKESELIEASGTFQGHLRNNRFDFKGGLTLRDAPFLSVDLSLPLKVETSPFKVNVLYDKKIKGTLNFQGKLEEILDFIDLGTHHISGDCTADFQLLGTWNHPQLRGHCDIKNGQYENYFTGTQIHQIEAHWKAKKNRLILEQLVGQDQTKFGEITATGRIELEPSKLFPFHFDLDIHRFTSVQVDLLTAEANGKLTLDGNLTSALAKGSIEVVEGELTIPKRIPKTFPRLEVVYLNATKPTSSPPQSTSTYPLHLDLSIDAPDSIFIAGRGLDSEWKGTFLVEGSNIQLAPIGKLELIRGNFVLSGRAFKLTEGTLLFRGKEGEIPYLNLAATMDVKDISIIARLKGPLNDPQITLQSVPPLPLSTIMAYLLFGQNLSEINSYQALQLANSIASLAGEGPDVLESTRRSLGVDQLNIITTPSGDDEVGDRIAVQVGKYISEGILVSLSQGAEESSTNISIEVELKGGFVLQFESDQQQEQGKFTFKWNHNY